MRIDLSNVVTASACALALTLAPASTGALDTAEGPTSAEIRTPLHELGLGKTFVIRAVETRPSAPAVTLVVIFFDAADRVVKSVTGLVSPGHPATFRLTRAEMNTDETAPTARAVVVVKHDGGFDQNQTLLDFNLVNRSGPDGCGGSCSICSRVGFSCAPPQTGSTPSVVCEGAAVVFTSEP
jgi:hypothetical protein